MRDVACGRRRRATSPSQAATSAACQSPRHPMLPNEWDRSDQHAKPCQPAAVRIDETEIFSRQAAIARRQPCRAAIFAGPFTAINHNRRGGYSEQPGSGGESPCASTDRTERGRRMPRATARHAGAFTLSESEARAGDRSPAALRTVGGIDALIALQGVDDDRAAQARSSAAAMRSMPSTSSRSACWREPSIHAPCNAEGVGAADLKDGRRCRPRCVLAEIELRVEVEIAKMAPRQPDETTAPNCRTFCELHGRPASAEPPRFRYCP